MKCGRALLPEKRRLDDPDTMLLFEITIRI
jgi:hypothetical protein